MWVSLLRVGPRGAFEGACVNHASWSPPISPSKLPRLPCFLALARIKIVVSDEIRGTNEVRKHSRGPRKVFKESNFRYNAASGTNIASYGEELKKLASKEIERLVMATIPFLLSCTWCFLVLVCASAANPEGTYTLPSFLHLRYARPSYSSTRLHSVS